MTIVVDDHLEHYGVPGMKWGKRKNAERREKNAIIDGARGRQAVRKAEVRQLNAQRITARTEKGKAHLDRKIANKKFEVDNNDDAIVAKQLKTSEKVMKSAKIVGLLGMSVVGLGAAASILNSELSKNNDDDDSRFINSSGSSRSLISSEKIYSPGDPGFNEALMGRPRR